MQATLLALAALSLSEASPVRRNDLASCLQSANVPALYSQSSGWAAAITPYNKRYEGQYIPAAVAQPKSVADVAAAVGCAAQFNVATVAKSGGHSYTSYSLGGQSGSLVIDLAALNTVTVDGEVATIGAGSRLGDVALSLFDQGERAFGHGTCPEVGIGGHALAGGFGLDSRQFGLSLDRVIEHEVVLSNGTVLHVNNATNSDLYWALRGAGWSMGIVTSFKVQTVAAPQNNIIYTYTWDLASDDAAQLLSAFQDFGLNDAPSALGTEVDIGKGSSQGRLSLELAGQFLGNQSEFDAAIAPFLAKVPTPSNSTATPYGWLAALETLGNVKTLNTTSVALSHDTFYEASLVLPATQPLSLDAWKAFAGYMANQGFNSDTAWFVQVELYGGKNSAIAAVPANATAFAYRDTWATLQLYASSQNYAPPYPSDGQSFVDGMRSSILNNTAPGFPVRGYLNYQQPVSDDSWKSLYFNSTYDTLLAIKKAYDPINLFRQPQAIGA